MQRSWGGDELEGLVWAEQCGGGQKRRKGTRVGERCVPSTGAGPRGLHSAGMSSHLPGKGPQPSWHGRFPVSPSSVALGVRMEATSRPCTSFCSCLSFREGEDHAAQPSPSFPSAPFLEE